MKSMWAWLRRLRGMFSKQQRELEFANELEGHLQMHIDDKVRAGMRVDEARRDAILSMGGLEQTRQAYRERGTVPLLETLSQDLRFAVRQLWKNPGFSVTAVLMLGLGIAASVSIFAFVDAVLLKPLPYPDPSRLVDVTGSAAAFPRTVVSYPDYLDFKRMNRSFRSLDAYRGVSYLLHTPAGGEPVEGVRVTDGFFRTLGVAPLIGRDFYGGEDLPSAPRAVILSYSVWQRRFGSRQDVVGQSVTLSGMDYAVIGVMPKSFAFAPLNSAEFWTAMHAEASNGCDSKRDCRSLVGVARLKDGVSAQMALADMTAVAKQLEQEYPDDDRDQRVSVLPLSEVIVGQFRSILLVLLAGSALLLLIACVNVCSLLMVRSESRKREIAVRVALGASPARLGRQFFAEAALLVSGSMLLGVGSAYFASRILLRLIPAEMVQRHMPYLKGLGINVHVLLFAGAIALCATALFALVPILRLSVNEMREGLTEGSRGSAGVVWRRIGANLIVAELAVAMVLLVGAGLLGKSFYHLMHVELNFQPDHLATLSVALPEAVYANDAQVVAGRRELLERVSALPGVLSATTTSLLPVSGNGYSGEMRVVGRGYTGTHDQVNHREVSPNYFATLKTRLVRGRFFDAGDDATKPRVVIVNQTFVRRYLPAQDPIGQRIGDKSLSPDSIAEITGVVDDLREATLDGESLPTAYYPVDQRPETSFNLIVRSSQDEKTLLPTIVSIIHGFDSGIGVSRESTMVEQVGDSQTAYLHRSSAWLVGGFAAMALLLGTTGLYGVVAYSVGQRTREIGVRMALGAPREQVHRMILREGGRLAALGIVCGIVCSLALTLLLRSMLFGVQSWDVATLAAVALLLATAALLASYIPARRAASINPVEALRAE